MLQLRLQYQALQHKLQYQALQHALQSALQCMLQHALQPLALNERKHRLRAAPHAATCAAAHSAAHAAAICYLCTLAQEFLRNLLACLFSLSAQSLFDSHVHLDMTSSRLGLPPTTSLYHLVTYDPHIPWDTFAGCVANRVAF